MSSSSGHFLFSIFQFPLGLPYSLLLPLLLLMATSCASQNQTDTVSSHVLDIANGRPAPDVECTAFKWVPSKAKAEDASGHWALWGKTKTNEQGRIPVVHPGENLTAGDFKLHFHTKEYFQKLGQSTFYPYIEVVFAIQDPYVHYHVPITLSNYGYSTYKGQ